MDTCMVLPSVDKKFFMLKIYISHLWTEPYEHLAAQLHEVGGTLTRKPSP